MEVSPGLRLHADFFQTISLLKLKNALGVILKVLVLKWVERMLMCLLLAIDAHLPNLIDTLVDETKNLRVSTG